MSEKMAGADAEAVPGEDNDDSWLYGVGPGELREGKTPVNNVKLLQKAAADPSATQEPKEKDRESKENEADENEDPHFNDDHFTDMARDEQDKTNGDAAIQEHADTDSDDSDDVKVTIGDIKSGPQAYASLNIKRGVGLVAAGAGDKSRTTPAPGKVTLEDLDGPGSINGVPALEFNIDTIEDKPWNKPGADISDYFNYGFNEVTWSAYCERQRRMRVNEAGVALLAGPPPRAPPPDSHLRRMQGPPRHDEGMQASLSGNYQARENTIQVMTAERREYGRAAVRDAPPEYFGAPPPEHYFPAHAPYHEPWGHPEQSSWAPSDIKELTPGPLGPPTMGMPALGPPGVNLAPLMPAPYAAPYRGHPLPHALERERDRARDRDRDDRDRRDRDRRDDEERERERERSRSTKPERIKEKSYRRERSRSRSRRHKSRSRSPRLVERSRERERERDRERERERSRDRERSRERERSIKPKSKECKEKDEDK